MLNQPDAALPLLLESHCCHMRCTTRCFQQLIAHDYLATLVRLQPLGRGQLAAQQAGSGTTLASDISASTGMPPQISSALRRQASDAAGPHAQPQARSPTGSGLEISNPLRKGGWYMSCCSLQQQQQQ